MYCIQFLLPVLLLPRPANPYLLLEHSLFLSKFLIFDNRSKSSKRFFFYDIGLRSIFFTAYAWFAEFKWVTWAHAYVIILKTNMNCYLSAVDAKITIFLVLYIFSAFLETRPCLICSLIFIGFLTILCLNCQDGCLMFPFLSNCTPT